MYLSYTSYGYTLAVGDLCLGVIGYGWSRVRMELTYS